MKKSTATKSFGTGNRETHDSSAFYKRQLFATVPVRKVSERINQIPQRLLDTVFPRSSESMTELPENCVSLMVTSPPYNVGKDYDLDLTLDEYLEFLKTRSHGNPQSSRTGRQNRL